MYEDRSAYNLMGPVRTLRIETSNYDITTGEVQPSRGFTLVRFREDGKISAIEYQNPDGSSGRTENTFDDAGRLAETRFTGPDGRVWRQVYEYGPSARLERVVAVEPDGSERLREEYRYLDDGRSIMTREEFAPAGTLFMSYRELEQITQVQDAVRMQVFRDRNGRAAEVQFFDAAGALIRRLVLPRDAQGKLTEERLEWGEAESPFPQLPAEAAKAAFEGRTLTSTTYAYDEQGRVREQRRRFGRIGDERVSKRYDQYGNLIEQISDSASTELHLGQPGAVEADPATTTSQHTRIEYEYDSRGNWTGKTILSRVPPDGEFRRTNAERRTLTYYDS
mgnify:CR=1 FL=1